MSRHDDVVVNLDRLHAIDVYRLADKERDPGILALKQALTHPVACQFLCPQSRCQALKSVSYNHSGLIRHSGLNSRIVFHFFISLLMRC